MKTNLKVNILWLFLLLAGYGLISVLVSAGVLNLFHVQILEQIGINIILAVGLNLIVGFSGQFSLGHAGFMAIGAYAAAIIGSKSPTYGAFFGAMVLGALISGAVALLVGIPTLRLKGDYLAVATLGVSEIIRIFIINGGSLTNGAAGILGIPNFTNWQMVYLFVVITTIATLNFLRSPIGRSTLSVREDEIAAESVGVNTTKIKIIAFVFGAITASIAGSLQAGFIGSVVPKDYTFINSINDYRCIWWTWIDYWYHRFSDCFRNFKYAPSGCSKRTYDYLRFGSCIGDDFQTRWTSWDMGIESITFL